MEKLNDDGVNHAEVLVLQEGEENIEEAIERTIGSVAYVLHEDESRTYYESFDEACNNAETNETVVVLRDYQYETAIKETLITVASGKTVVIDLNGKIIYGILNNNKSCDMIKVKGNLTIKDNTANSQGIGTGALRFGTSYSEAYAYTVSASIIRVSDGGNLTINSGNVVTYSTASGSYAIDATGAGGSVIVNGGHIESGYIGIRMYANNSSFTATAGEMIGNIWGVWFQKATSVNISGGYFGFTTDDINGRGISGYGTNTVITGGTVKNTHLEPGIDGCGYFDESTGYFFGAAKYDEKTRAEWEALGYSFKKPRTDVKYYQLTSYKEYMGAEDAIVGGGIMSSYLHNNPYKEITQEVLADDSEYWEMYGLASESVDEVPCSEGYHYSNNGDGTFTVVAD